MPVLSYDDLYARFLALPDHQIGEIIAGELVVSPRPTMPHAGSTSDILTQLRFRFGRKPGGGDNPGGWHLVVEPEIHLMDEILVPDIAGWKRDTLPLLPRAAFMSVPPDWVCEVLSEGTTRHDRRVKTRIYHRWGVHGEQ